VLSGVNRIRENDAGQCGGSRRRTAEALNIHPAALWRKMKHYRIKG
jgi:hypothetical protein